MIKELFYTPKEVANLLRINWRTLSNWRMQNKGPRWEKLGKYHTAKILYQERDISQMGIFGQKLWTF